MARYSKFYLGVQSKICGKNNFFRSLSRVFFGFWVKNFSDFRPKDFKKLSKLPSACPQEQLVALNFLKSFEPFWIFYRNLWHGSQNSIYVSRVKIALETVFLFFFSKFFRLLSENFFRLSAKELQKVVKTTFCVSTGTTCGFKFFKKFWTVMDFLQKPLAWFSNFYLRVQSKICGWNIFFILPFWIFPDFERKVFQTFGQKTSRVCQNYLLRVQRNNLWLEFFLSFESFPIFCKNHWHGSQKSIYVNRVKIAEKIVCFCFLFRIFFRILSENFSDFWPINFKKFSKLSSTCPEEHIVAWNNFFSSSFLNFSGFWAKHFSDFWPKNFKKMWKLPSACPEEQFVAWSFF